MDRTQLAQIEAIDRQNAFELGFFKAAQDAGLSKAEYEQMRKVAEDASTARGQSWSERALSGLKRHVYQPLRNNTQELLQEVPRGLHEMAHPRSREESLAGVGGAVLEGVRSGAEGFARAPKNPWSSVGIPAQLYGMGLRAVVNPPGAVGGAVSAAIQRGLKPKMTDVDDTAVEKANREQAPPNPSFREQLERAQR